MTNPVTTQTPTTILTTTQRKQSMFVSLHTSEETLKLLTKVKKVDDFTRRKAPNL